MKRGTGHGDGPARGCFEAGELMDMRAGAGYAASWTTEDISGEKTVTEEEWLAIDSDGLERMFFHIRSPYYRKQRLAVLAVLRVLATRFPGPRVDRLLSAYEDLADHRDWDRFRADLGGLSPWGDDLDHDDWVFGLAVRSGVRGFGNGGDCRVAEIRLAPSHRARTYNLPYEGPDHRGAAVAVVRDILGNPFRPVAIDPAWLTWHSGLLVSMARQMYDSRDFSDMPVLADALEEAGCDNADILAHCRQPGPNVRGCWVVDLLLGKE